MFDLNRAFNEFQAEYTNIFNNVHGINENAQAIRGNRSERQTYRYIYNINETVQNLKVAENVKINYQSKEETYDKASTVNFSWIILWWTYTYNENNHVWRTHLPLHFIRNEKRRQDFMTYLANYGTFDAMSNNFVTHGDRSFKLLIVKTSLGKNVNPRWRLERNMLTHIETEFNAACLPDICNLESVESPADVTFYDTGRKGMLEVTAKMDFLRMGPNDKEKYINQYIDMLATALRSEEQPSVIFKDQIQDSVKLYFNKATHQHMPPAGARQWNTSQDQVLQESDQRALLEGTMQVIARTIRVINAKIVCQMSIQMGDRGNRYHGTVGHEIPHASFTTYATPHKTIFDQSQQQATAVVSSPQEHSKIENAPPMKRQRG